MTARWLEFFKNTFQWETPIHPLDGGMAKKYIKQRLAVVYPAIKSDAAALEKAYQMLSLEPRPGIGKDEAPTVFEMTLPDIDLH